MVLVKDLLICKVNKEKKPADAGFFLCVNLNNITWAFDVVSGFVEKFRSFGIHFSGSKPCNECHGLDMYSM